MTRKILLFKINNLVVCEEHKELSIKDIYDYKRAIALELGCSPFDIEVDMEVTYFYSENLNDLI